MTVNELIKNLQDLVTSDPENGEATVVYASDDEGNSYQKIAFKPSERYAHDIKEWNLEMIDSEKDDPKSWQERFEGMTEEEKQETINSWAKCVIVN